MTQTGLGYRDRETTHHPSTPSKDSSPHRTALDLQGEWVHSSTAVLRTPISLLTVIREKLCQVDPVFRLDLFPPRHSYVCLLSTVRVFSGHPPLRPGTDPDLPQPPFPRHFYSTLRRSSKHRKYDTFSVRGVVRSPRSPGSGHSETKENPSRTDLKLSLKPLSPLGPSRPPRLWPPIEETRPFGRRRLNSASDSTEFPTLLHQSQGPPRDGSVHRRPLHTPRVIFEPIE